MKRAEEVRAASLTFDRPRLDVLYWMHRATDWNEAD